MLINRILASWQIRFALTTSILKETVYIFFTFKLLLTHNCSQAFFHSGIFYIFDICERNVLTAP